MVHRLTRLRSSRPSKACPQHLSPVPTHQVCGTGPLRTRNPTDASRDFTHQLTTGGTLELPIPPIALTGSTSDPGAGHCAPGAEVASLPREPGTRIAPGPREDGQKVETVGSTCFSPREPGTRIAPGPREDGRKVETVGTGSADRAWISRRRSHS